MNKVYSFEEVWLVDPSKKFNESYSKAVENLEAISYDDDIYPSEVMRDSRAAMHEVPKCIFIPAQNVIRPIIKAMLKKTEKMTDTEFLQ